MNQSLPASLRYAFTLVAAALVGATVADFLDRAPAPSAGTSVAADMDASAGDRADTPASSPAPPKAPREGRPSTGAPSESDLQALRDEVAAAELRLALLQGQREAVEGVPQPWTDDIPATDRPEAVEEVFQAALEAHGEGELLGMDCEEYPCVVAVEFPTAEDGTAELSREFFATLRETWNHPHSGSIAGTGFSEDHKRYFTVMAFYDRPEENVEAIDTRVKVRRDRFSEDLTASLSEEAP